MRPTRSVRFVNCLRGATRIAGCAVAIVGVTWAANAQTIPNAPTNLTASAASDFQINLSWTGTSTNATGFQIERSTDDVNFVPIAQVSSNATSYRNSGLFPNTTYY